MHGKPYWRIFFKDFAPDLDELAFEKELYWEEGSVPSPPEHCLVGACEKEHARYLELFK